MLSRTNDPAEFVTAFSGRIQSLSRVHTMLSDATWQGVDLRDLIRDQLLNGAVEEARITVRGPLVHLEAQLALHAAMMLHELGTNAVKYGALSTANGTVAISWCVKDAILDLRWEERGGPAVRAPTRRGFGRTLIERSATGRWRRCDVDRGRGRRLEEFAAPRTDSNDIAGGIGQSGGASLAGLYREGRIHACGETFFGCRG
jgi:two-component sensor histidine kinase